MWFKGVQKKVSGRWGCRPLVGMGVMEVRIRGAFRFKVRVANP